MPLWNQTLTALNSSSPDIRIHYDVAEYTVDPDDDDETPSQEDGEDDQVYEARIRRWRKSLIVLPEPKDYVTPTEDRHDFCYDLKSEFDDKGLQVIVKLANIHLTPEKPEYEGGTWHVEGQLVGLLCSEMG